MGKGELMNRQRLMGEPVEIEAYAPKWGIGTLLEFAYGGTINKIGIGIKPALIIGKEYQGLRDVLLERQAKKLIPKNVVDILSNPITDPDQFYERLCREFRTMR